MRKADKQLFVSDLTKKLQEAKGVILVNYSGLNVKGQQDLKLRLSEVDAKMVVVKNTLLKLAGEKVGIKSEALESSVLAGQTALIIANGDPVAPIQILGKFAKENETPKFKVGIIEGAFQDSETLVKISNLPTKDVLLSQLLGSLISPAYGIVSVLQGNLNKLVYILKEVSTRG